MRCDSLGDDYSEAAILERISGKRVLAPKAKTAALAKPNMLIVIQARMQQTHSPGFERWAKTFNLKEMAKTLIYLEERGLTGFRELEKACHAAARKFNNLSDQMKAADKRMKDISDLQRYIGTYSKTREIYMQYRKLTGRKQAKFYEQHAREIEACKETKRYFNSLSLKKLPSMQSFKQEYAPCRPRIKNGIQSTSRRRRK